jgi:hypothetical protein
MSASLTGDTACDEATEMAACDEALPDGAFLLVRRALAGLDPLTGQRPVSALPARMSMRGWRRTALSRVEVGQAAGWYWRCPRRSCDTWGGPFNYEHEAYNDGRDRHHDAHPKGKR